MRRRLEVLAVGEKGETFFGHRKSQRVLRGSTSSTASYKISEPFGMTHDAESMRLQRQRTVEEAAG